MPRRRFCWPLAVSVFTLTFCLLVVALLTTTLSTARDGEPAVQVLFPDSRSEPRAVSAVTRDLPKSMAAYNGISTPDTLVYAPWLLGRTSVLHVYNAGESPATVRATFTYADGVTITEKFLAAGAVDRIGPVGVLTGTRLSAILTGTQPIVAVVNDFGPDGMVATSYAAMPASLGRTYLALPSIFYKSGGGWGSNPVVQNVGTTTTTVTVFYTRTTGLPTTTYWLDTRELPPGQVHVFDPGDANPPENFVGIATVRAGQPVVAVVYNGITELGDIYPQHVFIYRVSLSPDGGGGSQPLYFPMLVNAFEDWTKSEIQFMNAAPVEANFDLEVGGNTVPVSIDPWWVVSRRQDDGSQAPGWFGAGRVPSASSLHSMVWLAGNFFGDSWAAYSAPSVGAKIWYLPYTDQRDDLNTYVAVQNLAVTNTAQVTLTYRDVTGAAVGGRDATIDPLDMGLYPTGISDFAGGVVVEADQPVVTVAILAGQLILDEEVYLPVIAKNN